MEIKTCEQYVLAEIERLKKELEDAYDRMFELDKELQEVVNQKEVLVDAIREAKKILGLEINEHNVVWVTKFAISKEFNPKSYVTLKALFELAEPDNDRTTEDTGDTEE